MTGSLPFQRAHAFGFVTGSPMRCATFAMFVLPGAAQVLLQLLVSKRQQARWAPMWLGADDPGRGGPSRRSDAPYSPSQLVTGQ